MEQIDRTRRYLERMRKIYSGAPYEEDPTCYTDDVLSFFIHCYHIRDWIEELNRLGITREEVNDFIAKHQELRICAELCDGTKHCRLDRNRKRWTSRQPHVATTQFVSGGTNDNLTTTSGRFQIMSEGTFLDALELAEKCMALWDEFVEGMKRTANQRSQAIGSPRPPQPEA